jgi:hypothetical protein
MRMAGVPLGVTVLSATLLIGCERDTERLVLMWLIHAEAPRPTLSAEVIRPGDLLARAEQPNRLGCDLQP